MTKIILNDILNSLLNSKLDLTFKFICLLLLKGLRSVRLVETNENILLFFC